MIRDLRALGDPERARGIQNYFKHELVALGIRIPAVRAFARARSRDLKKTWKLREAVQLCDRLLREPELETRSAGILVLGAFKTEFEPALLSKARRWLDSRLDNWALVDLFCAAVLSPLLEERPEVEAELRSWAREPSLWVRRALLVTFVPFARRGRMLDQAYAVAPEQFGAPEDLVHKAAGWLLREAGRTDMPRLRKALLAWGPSVPRTTLRYALERFPADERARLLSATRAG
jgi:3-methyladenine DNA glycosylase AlkD